MNPYLIISATQRKNSNSRALSDIYFQLLKQRNVESQILDLKDYPLEIFKTEDLNLEFADRLQSMKDIFNKADKIIFVVAEYNGSFPGTLKLFIDSMDYPNSFTGKKAALSGHSAGSQGSALGLSHLTDILNYLGVNVLAQKPKMQFIDSHLRDNNLHSSAYLKLMNEQMDAFLKF